MASVGVGLAASPPVVHERSICSATRMASWRFACPVLLLVTRPFQYAYHDFRTGVGGCRVMETRVSLILMEMFFFSILGFRGMGAPFDGLSVAQVYRQVKTW